MESVKKKISDMLLRISDHIVEGIMNECVRSERKKRENKIPSIHDMIKREVGRV